jgi:hypothetical protein
MLHQEVPFPFVDRLAFRDELRAAPTELHSHFLLVFEDHLDLEAVPIQLRLKGRT